MIRCIIIAEDDSDGEVYEFETEEEFDAFDKGVRAAAELYGAGGCGAYRACDKDNLDADQAALIEKYLG